MFKKVISLPLFCLVFSSGVLSNCSHSQVNSKKESNAQMSLPLPDGQIQTHYGLGEITNRCSDIIDRTQKKLSALESPHQNVPQVDGKRFSKLIEFEAIMADLSQELSPMIFMSNVSTEKKVSDEAAQCAKKLGDFEIDVYTRRDLYSVLKGQKAKGSEEQRLLSETLKDFEKNGLKLSDEPLQRVKIWMQKLNENEVQFSKNLAQDISSLQFERSELAGAPTSFLERLSKDAQGRFVVSTKSTDYSEVMENVSVPETRRKMLYAYMNRGGKQNTDLLEESIELRRKIALELGFKSWVDYKTQDRMASNAEVVAHFLNQLKSSLMKRSQQDLRKLLELKKKEDPTATQLHQWDVPYYTYQLKKTEFHIDDEEIRQFFSVDSVMIGMFDLYSLLLGVRFEIQENAPVWAPQVKFYHVIDVLGDRKGDVIGSFYLDLIPRPFKYGHAAVFPLRKGRVGASGQYVKPVAAMVANFNPPTQDKPSLLSHSQVVTFFHEFGHIVHQVLTRAPYASLSGTSVARDFVEAPSQMLENWAWSAQVIQKISQNYRSPHQTLPDEFLRALIRSRGLNQGYFYTRQLYLGLLDYSYHTSEQRVQTTPLADELYRKLLGIDPIAGGNFPATFGHLMSGYDAGYYGYLWSEVYSSDLFREFEKQGLFQAQLGLKYRKCILEPGNMKPNIKLIEGFLGRKPNQKAFLKRLQVM